MKIWPVFSFVLVMHLVIIGLFLVQPGCQNQPVAKPDPSITQPAPSGGSGIEPQPERSGMRSPSRPAGQLDPAFNAGLGGETTAGRLSAPRRPETSGVQRTEPEASGLEPVLEPVRQTVAGVAPGSEYTVRAGDTLAGIARREGIGLEEMLASNGLSRNSTIYVGQSLLIPERQPDEADAGGVDSAGTGTAPGKTIEVARGDTLSGLASRHGTTLAALKAANDLQGETIYVGQSLRVPGAASPQRSGAGSTRAREDSAASGDGLTYEVQAGDTPSGIARRYGISARELMRANGINDPRKLFVGQTLHIPGQGDAGRSASREAVRERRAQPERGTADADSGQGTAVPGAQPERRNRQRDEGGMSAPRRPEPEAEAEEDPLSALEALEADELPFVEVEESTGEEAAGN